MSGENRMKKDQKEKGRASGSAWDRLVPYLEKAMA